MGSYILRRILLMIPTLLGIMAISFAVIQFAPGGPVEQVIANLTGQGGGANDRLGSGGGGDAGGNNFEVGGNTSSKYRGAQGLDPEFIAKLEKQFGFVEQKPDFGFPVETLWWFDEDKAAKIGKG
jgi:microcin C transport system permease protein